MSDELGTSRPRRLGNHYIPPPARKHGSGIVETRVKERPSKTCSNENEKLCNDSSLLFKDSYNEMTISLKSKRRRRGQKEPKSQKNSGESPPLVDDFGRSDNRNAANLQSTLNTSRTPECPIDNSFEPTAIHINQTYVDYIDPCQLCQEQQRIPIIAQCDGHSDDDVTEPRLNSERGPDMGIPSSFSQLEKQRLPRSRLPLRSLSPEPAGESMSLTSSFDTSSKKSFEEVASSSDLNKGSASNFNVVSPAKGLLTSASLDNGSINSNHLVPTRMSLNSNLPDKVSARSNLLVEFNNSSDQMAENNMLSTTSENVKASSNTQPGIDENSEIPLITGAVERLSMNTQGHKEVHQSSSIGMPVNNERTPPNSYSPPAKAGCDNMSSAEAATKHITPISSYSHNPILSVDNIDDSDWDSLYDDRGDCIIPHVEAQHSRGKSKHQVSPPINQSKYSPSKQSVDEDAYQGVSTIIEIYGFPEELKTSDLMTVFCNYIERGFNLKWVDNTHALGVLPTTALAEEILGLNLPIVKTRPISQGIALSQEKAKNLVLPSALRPKTCTALARRLVSGALGLRVSVTPAERAAERELLKEAREKKKLVSKQKEAAWEGNFSSSTYCDGKDPS
ncbi:R3H domain and coiled-coil containing 1-like [Nesidiocoris tenuis]|uniref:R3H domain and coiled-coil containing 1-like n=1 Tax=Nesidiocoris tenuis TaxID=355587 RepID=A0ABN7AIL1_9HEMI|nr:R3H domain and coiled-coil containing 1-like [Nesidiocoris tenuis]